MPRRRDLLEALSPEDPNYEIGKRFYLEAWADSHRLVADALAGRVSVSDFVEACVKSFSQGAQTHVAIEDATPIPLRCRRLDQMAKRFIDKFTKAITPKSKRRRAVDVKGVIDQLAQRVHEITARSKRQILLKELARSTGHGENPPKVRPYVAPVPEDTSSGEPFDMSRFAVPASLGENPFPQIDERHAKWEAFSLAGHERVAYLISGLRDLQHVVDESSYMEWRQRHPEAPNTYDRDQVTSWRGREGLILIRSRFNSMAVEAVSHLMKGPDDLPHAQVIVENLATAMRQTFGDPDILDVDAWVESKMRLVSDLLDSMNLPPRRWRVAPYDRDRSEEKRVTPLIVRLMKACGTEFEHGRQAVDACFDLLCREGLSEDQDHILFLGNALTTLCERLEIESLSNRQSEEATLFAKLQVQFKRVADEGLAECRAERLPLARPERPSQDTPSSAGNSNAVTEVSASQKDDRKFLYASYRKACKAAGVALTERTLAKLANPAWGTRDPIAKWKQGKDRHGDDAKIRAVIAKGPPKRPQKA